MNEGVKLTFDTFGPAWATVATELRKTIEHEQKRQEKAAQQSAKSTIVDGCVLEPAVGEEARDTPPEPQHMTAADAINLEVIRYRLTEVGGDPEGKKQLLSALYELALESFVVYEESTGHYPNNITRATLNEMIKKLQNGQKI